MSTITGWKVQQMIEQLAQWQDDSLPMIKDAISALTALHGIAAELDSMAPKPAQPDPSDAIR